MCCCNNLDKGSSKSHTTEYLELCSLINYFQVYLRTYCKSFKYPYLAHLRLRFSKLTLVVQDCIYAAVTQVFLNFFE